MRKTFLATLFYLPLCVFLVTGISRAGMHEETVNLKLAPVPGVKSDASGTASFKLSKDGTAVHYKLNLTKIDNATMSHIHTVGMDGKRGAVIVWLYPTTGMAPSLKEGAFIGTLAEGDITSDKLGGPWKGKSAKDLFEGIEYGTLGVAVHTKQNPGTELWGVSARKAKTGEMERKKGEYEEREHKGGGY